MIIMKEYVVKYRKRGNKGAEIFETSLTADNVTIAKQAARQDLENGYVIISCKLA